MAEFDKKSKNHSRKIFSLNGYIFIQKIGVYYVINKEGQEIIFEKCDDIFPHWSDKAQYGKILNNKMEFINLDPPNMLRISICKKPFV